MFAAEKNLITSLKKGLKFVHKKTVAYRNAKFAKSFNG